MYSSAGTGPFSRYIILSSKKTTGLSSRMADLHQALGVVGRRRQHHFQPRNVAQPGVQRLRMLRRGTPRRAQRRAQDHGHFPVAAGHVVDLGGLVHHLVHDQRQKSPNMMSTTGRSPVIAAPTPMPVNPGSEIGVSITRCLAELLHQPGEHLERRARFGHVFAQDADARVAAHFFGQRFADGLRRRSVLALLFVSLCQA